jgi:hypothetical protein
LLLATAGNEFGKQVKAPTKHEGKKCVVLRDLIIRNVGPEHTNMAIKSFPGIRNEKLHRVMENRNLGSPDTVLHHLGKKDSRLCDGKYALSCGYGKKQFSGM